METDNSIIIGERHPIIGYTYTYVLRNPETNIAIRWEIWRGNKRLENKDVGEFMFHDLALEEGFVIHAYYLNAKSITQKTPFCAMFAVKVKPGNPEFVSIAWQDSNMEDIGNKHVSYLDDIYLTVRTANIPKGNYISVKIINTFNSRSGNTFYAYVDEHSIARFKASPELLKCFGGKDPSRFLGIDYYYAKVSYSGEVITTEGISVKNKQYITKVENSERLTIAGFFRQTTPPKNGVKPVVVEKDNIDEKRKDPIKIKLNVFFDGTKNNRGNVKLVKDASTKEEKGKIIKQYGKESSYDQGYSNVAIMQWSDGFQESQKEISIYIEGVGTRDRGGDVTYGLVTAYGNTGLIAKVEKAITQILDKREDVVDTNKETVVEVKVNVFGFSRGAATARHFVSTKRPQIAVQLTTSRINVIFTFVGLFDTVASYGLKHSNDTKELSLDMGGKAQKVLQLKALNEYRANFSLTDITSSIQAGVGYELGMPGAHSNIGGGYKDSQDETLTDYAPCNLIDRLIAEGWHTEKENIGRRYDYVSSPTGGAVFKTPVQYIAKRTIANAYQYIPLTIMVNFAEKYGGMAFTDELNKYYAKIPAGLTPYRTKFVSEAINKDGAHSVEIDPLIEKEEKELRHNFLHLSAYKEGGQQGMTDFIANGGRYNENGQLEREILEG